MKSKSPGIFLAILAIVWLTLAVSLYYVSNKPITPEVAAGLVWHLWRILIAGVILSISGGLGKRITRLIMADSKDKVSPLVLLSIEATVGFLFLGLLILVIGSTLGITVWILGSVLVLLAVIVFQAMIRWLKQWEDLEVVWRGSGRFEKLVAIGTILLLAFSLLWSLAPPIKFDALVYHLTLPRVYVDQGRIGYVPEIMYWGMPQMGEMLYTLGIPLGGEQGATVVGWSLSIVALVGISGYIRDRFNGRAAWAAVTSLLAGYTLVISPSWGYVDWLALLFGSGFVICLDLWRQQNNPEFLALTGLLAGGALSTKYTAGILLLAGLVVVIWQSYQNRSKVYRSLLLFLGVAFLTSSPWWLRNWIATGNPIYPLLFPAGAMNPLRLDFYQNHPVQLSWHETLLLPLSVTWRGVEGAPGFGVSIGPLLLGLSGLAWIGWRGRAQNQQQIISTAAIVTAVGFLTWAIASRLSDLLTQTRLYFSMLPAWAILAGAGFSSLENLRLPRIRLGRIAIVFILLALFLNLFKTGTDIVRKGVLNYLVGERTSQVYLEQNLGWYIRAMQTIQDLPDGVRVLTLFEPRSLYCEPKCQPDEILDRWVTGIREFKQPGLVLENWRQTGYTHLLFYRTGAEFIRQEDNRYTSSEWQALDELLSKLPPPIEIGGGYELYSLTP